MSSASRLERTIEGGDFSRLRTWMKWITKHRHAHEFVQLMGWFEFVSRS
jgi:hypothetical protein